MSIQQQAYSREEQDEQSRLGSLVALNRLESQDGLLPAGKSWQLGFRGVTSAENRKYILFAESVKLLKPGAINSAFNRSYGAPEFNLKPSQIAHWQ